MTNALQHLNLSHEDYHGHDQIRVGDRTSLPISHIGSVSLNLSRRTFILNQLLRVPLIYKNLLFVRQFALDNSVFFEFHLSYFVIKDSQTGIILHQGRTKDGLYHLLLSSGSSSVNQALVGDCTSPTSWHKHLGHLAFRTVHSVISQFQLPVHSNKASTPCKICPQAKGHQLPFSSSTSSICKPLELVYSDVWGPSPTLSINGNRFYVSFIDAYSRYTWVFPIQAKSDVMPTFLQFQAMAERLLNSKIISVQSDWGGEYHNLHSYFQTHGITHRISCPHTHQQQGCVERKHRHLIDTTLALLAESHLPKKFWDEACLTSCYLINRLPTPLLQNKSPFEKLFNQIPDYKFLKVFGCACFPNLRPYNSHKFSPCSKECLFLGYSQHHKAINVFTLILAGCTSPEMSSSMKINFLLLLSLLFLLLLHQFRHRFFLLYFQHLLSLLSYKFQQLSLLLILFPVLLLLPLQRVACLIPTLTQILLLLEYIPCVQGQ
jgi:hypothetical protein